MLHVLNICTYCFRGLTGKGAAFMGSQTGGQVCAVENFPLPEDHDVVGALQAFELSRQSDIRLTLGIYTHLGVHDQIGAIDVLLAPPVEALAHEHRDERRLA